MKIKNLAITILFLAVVLCSSAQKAKKYDAIEYSYNAAKELYEKGMYASAQKSFFEIMNLKGIENSLYKDDAAFYFAMCSMQLFNKDAEYQLNEYAESHPESSNINDASFQMANYYYRDKKHKNALEWYKKVDRTELDTAEQSEYYFKMGYCYFARKDFDLAAKSFYETKDKEDIYGTMSLYFYSHLKYTNEQYQTALIGFLKLKDNPSFSAIIPFYILQIYYLQKNYTEVIKYAETLGEDFSGAAPENAKIIGLSYTGVQKYTEAIPYLKKYMEANSSTSDFDYYELGYALYSTKQYDEAAKNFGKITKLKDTIGQNAAYLMGDCYLKTDKKLEARRSFETASLYNYNPTIKEDALFNFAQLSFELSLSPFNEAISAFTRYIEEYPNSPRTEYAYDYLLDAFMSAKNYQRAILTIEKLKSRNTKIDIAYQRLTYLRGLEFFTELNYENAIEMFDKSLKYKQYNKSIESLSHYWKAESNYRLGNIDLAIDQFKEFVNSTGSVSLDEYGRAQYNIGYAYFNKKNYTTANTWFRKFEMNSGNEKSTIVNDVLNRIGDCYYINKEFAAASEYYKKAVAIGLIETDYSLYQLSLSYGGQKMANEKIWSLQRLLKEYENSEYASNAMFEIARSYQTAVNNEDSAKYYYEMLIAEYPNSAMKKVALSNLGAIAFNKKQFDKSLDYYKQVIADYPGSEEANNANEMIKSIYLEMDKPDAYIEYANSEGSGVEISQDEQDEIMWLAAKKLYIDKKYNDALTSIDNYLSKFKNGKFSIEANYYKAELHLYFEEKDEALICYRTIADARNSTYSEESTIKAAAILFDKENWNDAYNYYEKLYSLAENKSTKLIASIGKLRCSYNIKNYENVISSAIEVVESEKSNEEQIREAYYKMAKAYYAKNNMVRALSLYETLSKEVTSYEGSESKYMTAEINYKNGEDSIAEEIIYAFAQSSTPHAYWLAKSYILLADIYFNHEDIFSAKHTLQSVLNNYDNETDGIKEEAGEKLTAIFEAEEAAKQEEEVLKLKINLIEDNSEESLFPDEDFELKNKPAEIENNNTSIKTEQTEQKTNTLEQQSPTPIENNEINQKPIIETTTPTIENKEKETEE